jgi:ankyrin repeat protein
MKYLLAGLVFLRTFLFSSCTDIFTSSDTASAGHYFRNRELISSIETKDYAKFYYALDNGADVNFKKDNITPAVLLAVYYGQPEFVKELVTRGADLTEDGYIVHDEQTYFGSPLAAAVGLNGDNYFEIMRYLVEECRADVTENEYNPLDGSRSGWPPIAYAATFGDLEKLQYLMSHGADLLYKDSRDGGTLLHLAAGYGSIDVIEFLVNDGININEVNNDGMSALFYSDEFNISYLIQSGINSEIRDNKGRTAKEFTLEVLNATEAHWYVFTGDLEALKNLEKSTLSIKDSKNLTPLDYAIYLGKNESIRYLLPLTGSLDGYNTPLRLSILYNPEYFYDLSKQFELSPELLNLSVRFSRHDIMRFLIDKGLDVNYYDGNNSYPLMYAVLNNDLESARYLVEHGARINSFDKELDISPMHISARNSDSAMLEYLHTNGGDINSVNSAGETPLFDATYYNAHNCMVYLFKNGVNIDHYNKSGENALHIAARENNTRSLRLLFEYGADLNQTAHNGDTPLLYALKNGNHYAAELLIYYNTNLYEYKESSPLHHILYRDYYDLFEYAVENLAFVDLQDENGTAPLALSMNKDDLSYAERLITHGADVNAVDKWGLSPLFYAVQYKNTEALQLLIKNGVKLEKLNSEEKTALRYAFEKRSYECAAELIKAGADVKSLSKGDGKDALALAVQHNRPELIKLITEHSEIDEAVSK